MTEKQGADPRVGVGLQVARSVQRPHGVQDGCGAALTTLGNLRQPDLEHGLQAVAGRRRRGLHHDQLPRRLHLGGLVAAQVVAAYGSACERTVRGVADALIRLDAALTTWLCTPACVCLCDISNVPASSPCTS